MTPQLHMSARRPSYFSPWKGEAPAMMASPQAPTRRLCPPPARAHLDHLRTRVVGGPAGERRCEPPASCYPLSPGARGGGPTHPQLVSRRLSPTCRDAMPKSAMRMLFFSSKSRFSGFRSLWLRQDQDGGGGGGRLRALHSSGRPGPHALSLRGGRVWKLLIRDVFRPAPKERQERRKPRAPTPELHASSAPGESLSIPPLHVYNALLPPLDDL